MCDLIALRGGGASISADRWMMTDRRSSIVDRPIIKRISSSTADADAPAADHSTAVVAASYRFQFLRSGLLLVRLFLNYDGSNDQQSLDANRLYDRIRSIAC